MKTQIALEGISTDTSSSEQLQSMSRAINQIIENIATQGQINTRIVARLLDLEEKVGAQTTGTRRPTPRRKR